MNKLLSAFIFVTISFCAKAQNKTTTTSSRMVGESYYSYSTTSSNFIFTDSSAYTYSGDHGGDALTPPQYDTRTVSTGTNGTPQLQYNYISIYDAYDNIAIAKVTKWNTFTQNWDNDSITHTSLNGINYIDTDTVYWWNGAVDIPAVSHAYAYTHSGKQAVIYTYLHNGTAWQPNAYTTCQYLYSSSDKLTEYILFYNTVNSSLNKRETYVYDGSGQPIERKGYDFEKLTNQWINRDVIYYHYNSNGQCDEQVTGKWQRFKMAYDTIGRYSYAYDAGGSLIETVYSTYNSVNLVYTNLSRHQYTYNSYAQRITEIRQTWDGFAWNYSVTDYKRYYYYDVFALNTLSQMKTQECSLRLYPVPANNILNVAINRDIEQSYTLTIADMMGRVVYSDQGIMNREQSVIDVSALPAGAYNIILRGDKGGVQHSRFSVVR
ncbi:MAG: T9SS type A sorting domain-containing protein [Sphingobacteriales bacterium]|nr:MAG: T9SS type A sorting domain-containing protein [Sphingobacteriales bacterium]